MTIANDVDDNDANDDDESSEIYYYRRSLFFRCSLGKTEKNPTGPKKESNLEPSDY